MTGFRAALRFALFALPALFSPANGQGFAPPPMPGAPAGIFAPAPGTPAEPDSAAPPVRKDPGGEQAPPASEAPPRGPADPPLSPFRDELENMRFERVDCLPSWKITRLAWESGGEDPERAGEEGGRKLHIGTADAGVAVYDLRLALVHRVLDPSNVLPRADVTALHFQEPGGPLRVGTGRGLFEVDPDAPALGRELHFGGDPPSDAVRAVTPFGPPAEGKVLVATASGIYRYDRSPDPPRRIGTPSAEGVGRVHALLSRGEFVHAAADMGLFRSRDGEQWERIGGKQAIAGQPGLDRRGLELVGATVTGIARLRDGDGEARILGRARGLPEEWITSVAFDRFPETEDKRGTESAWGIWAGLRTKGFAVGAGEGFRVISASSGIVSDDRATAVAATGFEVFCGSEAGGLIRFAPARPVADRKVSRWIGFPRIHRLATDGTNLYVGTVKGLFTCRDLNLVQVDDHLSGTLPEDDDVRDVALDVEGRLFVYLGPKFGVYRPDPAGPKFVPVKGFDNLPSKSIARLFDLPGFGMHFAMDGIEGKLLQKIGHIAGDRLLPRPAKPFDTLYTDGTAASRAAPHRVLFDPERAFASAGGKRPLVQAQGGVLRPVERPPIETAADLIAFGGSRTAIATEGGLLLHHPATGFTLEPGSPKVSVANARLLLRDPETPDSLFAVCPGAEGKSRLVHRMGERWEEIPLDGEVIDLVYVRPFLYLACADEILFLPIRPIPASARPGLAKQEWEPGKTIGRRIPRAQPEEESSPAKGKEGTE